MRKKQQKIYRTNLILKTRGRQTILRASSSIINLDAWIFTDKAVNLYKADYGRYWSKNFPSVGEYHADYLKISFNRGIGPGDLATLDAELEKLAMPRAGDVIFRKPPTQVRVRTHRLSAHGSYSDDNFIRIPLELPSFNQLGVGGTEVPGFPLYVEERFWPVFEYHYKNPRIGYVIDSKEVDSEGWGWIRVIDFKPPRRLLCAFRTSPIVSFMDEKPFPWFFGRWAKEWGEHKLAKKGSVVLSNPPLVYKDDLWSNGLNDLSDIESELKDVGGHVIIKGDSFRG